MQEIFKPATDKGSVRKSLPSKKEKENCWHCSNFSENREQLPRYLCFNVNFSTTGEEHMQSLF